MAVSLYPAFPYAVTIIGSWLDVIAYLQGRDLKAQDDYLAGTGGPGRSWHPNDPCFTIYFKSKTEAITCRLYW